MRLQKRRILREIEELTALFASICALATAQGASPPSHPQIDQALLQAATEGNPARVRELLRRGAHINAEDVYHQTPLILAAQQGHTAVLRLLLAHGAAMEARDRDGNTALLQATDEGQVQAVRLLLARGANFRAKNRFGSDALWLTGRKEQPADAEQAAAIRKLLLASMRQAKRHAAVDEGVSRRLKALYARYAQAYHAGDWKTVAALLTPNYTFYDWDGGSSSRKEWMQTLQQQQEEHPDDPFWFVLETVTAHGNMAYARVIVPAHILWKDTWRRTARGWRLQHTQMWGVTTEAPSGSVREKEQPAPSPLQAPGR